MVGHLWRTSFSNNSKFQAFLFGNQIIISKLKAEQKELINWIE